MTELLPLMTYCFVMSSTPGPNNVMLTASGANFGYRGALPQILGVNAGSFVQTYLTCLGLGAVFTAYPAAHTALRLAGSLYLLYLAWQITGSSVGEARMPRPVSFAQGALFQAVNPKSWVKAVTLASVFMPADMGVATGRPARQSLVGAGHRLSRASRCGRCSAWAIAPLPVQPRPPAARLQLSSMAASLAVLAIMFLR